MAVLDVVVAPDARFDAVREVLADWRAAGWVRDHCWTVSADPSHPVLRVTGAGVAGRDLAGIAATERFERVHLVYLAWLEDDGSDRGFADLVGQAFGATPVTRIHALFAGADDAPRFSHAAVGGWHTVVIAPEDGAGPQNAGLEVRDTVAGAAAIASSLAGILGLWTGHERSPLDAEHVPADGSVRLVRSYMRRLAAHDVETSLRRQVLTLGDRLPLPVHAGTPTVRIEDVGLASRTMAQQFWERHRGMLRGPREAVRAAPPKAIGAGDALRLFFSFLGAALRNAPRRWLQSTLNSVRARTAAVVQDVVYGSGDSAYSVVVGGMTADGRPASWVEQRDVSERLAKALEHRVPVQHHALDDTAVLWQDYVDGALTLADAGERVPAMPPVTIGTRRGVMPGVADIVPGPEARFSDVSPAVTASIGSAQVEAYDLLGSVVLRDRLRRAAGESSIGMPAAEAAHRLEEWRARYSGAYAVQVGGGIAAALSGLHEEVRTILGRLKRASETEDSAAAMQKRQARLTRVLQVLAGMALIVIAVVVVLLVAAVVSVLAAVITILVVVIAWAASSLGAFVQGQRALFALLNERARLVSQQDVDERNLVLALRDVRRVSDLYEQFLLWSEIIGTFLAEPLGRPGAMQAAPTAELEGLPLSVVSAVAVPGEDRIGLVANELRREVFGAGWLSGPWAAVLADAPALLGARGGELRDRPEAVYQQRGDAEGLLVPWLEALADRGTPATAGEAVWGRAAQVLDRPDRAALRDQLVGTVRRSDGVEQPVAQFLADTDEGAAMSGRFSDTLLSSAAIADRRTAVGTGRVDEVRSGLGVERVLVQLSVAIPEYELAGYEQERGPGLHGDVPIGGGRVAGPATGQEAAIESPFGGETF